MVDSGLWAEQPMAATVVCDAITTAAEVVRVPSGAGVRAAVGANQEVSVVLTDDDAIRRLNRQWRGQDKPTNVLSFPTAQSAVTAPGAAAAVPAPLGDI